MPELTQAEQAAVDAGFETSQLRTTQQPQTATDAAGTERITVPAYGSAWEPAPVDPDPADVAKAEAREALFAEQREGRLASSAPADTTTSNTATPARSTGTSSTASSSPPAAQTS